MRSWKRLRELDQAASSSASDISQFATALEKRFHVGHRRDPLLQEQILKPRGRESFQTVPHHVGVLRLRNAASPAKRGQNSVEYTRERRQHLIHAADEKRAVLVGEHGGVLDRQAEALCGSVVVQIIGRGHAAQPFAQIALVQFRSRRELS